MMDSSGDEITTNFASPVTVAGRELVSDGNVVT